MKLGLTIARIFTWWQGATYGLLLTLRGSEFVGEDEFGNRYFQKTGDKRLSGRTRRWVVYNGYADASRVPSDWHGWMHHTFDEPPTTAPFKSHTWEKRHQPNLTGTLWAYHPRGSLWRDSERPAATGDYEAWSPDDDTPKAA